MLESLNDTVVACATPSGVGALAVVRLSGPQALAIGQKIAAGTRCSHQLVLGRIFSLDGELLDEGMIAEMHRPRSYTGEDSVEFYLHGSRAVVSAVIECCIEHGARLAGPGEFTMRAFLNGRIDLTQAEAVADLIASESDMERQTALRQLKGSFASRVNELIEALEGVLADWRAALDFPEYPTGEGLIDTHWPVLMGAEQAIRELWSQGKIAKLKRSMVLCGAPNVGKSTLLNAWMGEERVLVDATPGTTRDPVEVVFQKDACRYSLWDTAGIREADGLEARGIAMALERARQADLCLWLVTPINPVWPPEELALAVVGSKADVATAQMRQMIEEEAARRNLPFLGWISGVSKEGVAELQQHLSAGMGGGSGLRERHLEALRVALDHLEKTGQAYDLPLDLRAMELELSIKSLAGILGRDVDSEVLRKIFAAFCIGK
jgi:tRNA modification GTPase